MLVVATFPIIDRNDCLLRDIQKASKDSRCHMYAAITFRRPIFSDYVEYLSHSGASEHRAQLANLFRQAGFRGESGQSPLPMERSMG